MKGYVSQLRFLACAAFSIGFIAAAVPAEIPLSKQRSGYADLGRDTKAMQDDDFDKSRHALGIGW